MEYKYNLLGEVVEKKDQLGTVHKFDYDKLGRLLHDRVDTLGTNVDGAVRRISRSYEVRGLLEKLTSYNDPDPTHNTGTVVNDILFVYNDFEQVSAEYQEHGGTASGSSRKVQYAYADGTDKHIRPASMTYPDGRVISYDYGAANSKEDMFNRVLKIKQGASDWVVYSYLGLKEIIKASYVEPGVDLTYLQQSGESVGEAGDQYTGLDRFGRVVDQRWRKTSDGSHPERIQYGFDRVSNRTFRDSLVSGASGQDELYTYDGFNQLKNLDRGDLNGSQSALVGTPVREEDFAYDKTGNWGSSSTTSAYVTKASGTVDLDQKRVHTKANELESISTTTGTAWWTPTPPNKYYDAAGNFVAIPQAKTAATMANKYDLTYDAWNRLVKIMDGGSTVGTYQYDGAHRRATATTGGSTRDVYFTKDWQAVEERVGGTLDRQNVWGMRYADDLVLRDRDTNGDGTLDERRHALHDYFHVTAITNSAGAVQERYGFDGFGAARVMSAAYGSSSTSSQTTDVGFGAYQWDKESGLYLARHRYLHPRLGRWLTRDPIEYGSLKNLFDYVHNNPTDLVDPDGLQGVVIRPPTGLNPGGPGGNRYHSIWSDHRK